MLGSARSKPKGLTLVEVMAAVVLISTLLVSTLVGFTRSAQQIRRVEQRNKAIRLTDVLIAEWFATGEFPKRDHAAFSENSNLSWRTSTRPAGIDDAWNAKVLIVEVLESKDIGIQSGHDKGNVLLTIELLIPIESADRPQIPSPNPDRV